MTTFSTYERMMFDEILNFEETTSDNIQSLLHPDIYEFLRKNDNINTILDRKIVRDKNQHKPYDSAIFTKYITDKLDIGATIMDLAKEITGRFLIYIDFHSLFLCSAKESEGREETYKLQTASKASAMNATVKITNVDDLKELAFEFKSQTRSDILNDVFQHHVSFFEYENSGMRPYQLLSLVIHLQKFP